MSTRASNARHVRQRKLNTKQPLRIIRENEVEEAPDDESQRQIPQVETGVEKGEESEHHLQAIISASAAAALGKKSALNVYIPTPEATKAKGVHYDQLYPKAFSEPSTYIRFSSTVEDCIGVPYCVNDDDVAFMQKLNSCKAEPERCSADAFEEVMYFFEETTQRLQPFSAVDDSPILTLEEMERSVESSESISLGAQRWLKDIYKYWGAQKGSRPLMPAIKVRVLDTTSEADDADPYICFRRREVRQTRKTRGRDAQVVEKLKKLRLELEQARQLVQMIVQREQLNKEQLEVDRKVFEQRGELKKVKIAKSIVGEKGEDEAVLINQKPAPKASAQRRDTQGLRPPTIRLRSGDARQSDNEGLVQLAELQAEANTAVQQDVESKIAQHARWNRGFVDGTWGPITPPPELDEIHQEIKWKPLFSDGQQFPTPPATIRDESSASEGKVADVDAEDVDMKDIDAQPQPPVVPETDALAGAEPDFRYRTGDRRQRYPTQFYEDIKRLSNPPCRIRIGRGGRRHLECRRQKPVPSIARGVVSDSDSEDDMPSFYQVPEKIQFEYRTALNSRLRPTSQELQMAGGAATAGHAPAS